MGRQRLPEISLRTGELAKCTNCGLCLAVCPTYLVKGSEGLTARGKIALLKALLGNEIEPSAGIADLFDDCLTCYACQSVCPSDVRTQNLWTAVRQDMAGLSKSNRLKRLGLNWTIGKPKLFDFEVKSAGRVAGFDRSQRQAAKLGRFGFPVCRGAPYLKQLKEEYPPHNDEIGSIGLLLGCSVNISTPWVADAVIYLLNSAGWRIIIPKEQVCCGAPAINNACWDLAKRLALENMAIFSDLGVNRVTSADATCAGAFKHDYLELFKSDVKTLTQVVEFSALTTELSALIAEAVDDGRLKFNPLEAIVTLHDSCHVTHVGGGSRWRSILEKIEGLDIRDLPDSDHCCGFGGSYAIFHNRTSVKIAERKAERVVESGADQVLVGSPGCLLRIQSIMDDKSEHSIRIRHVAELLADVVKEV